MTYSLLIPIFNESRTLPTLLKKLDKLNDKIEIIIIDDGSNDETKNLLSKYSHYVIIRNETNLGKGASIRKGVSLASNKNIIFMDGDLEVEIDDIPQLITKFENKKIDALTGVRWEKKFYLNTHINTLGNYIINGIFNLLFKSNFNDVLCCMKILDKDIYKSLDVRSNGFSIEVETMAKLVLRKSVIDEVKIKYSRRSLKEGKKLKISDSWHIIWTMFKIRFTTKSNF